MASPGKHLFLSNLVDIEAFSVKMEFQIARTLQRPAPVGYFNGIPKQMAVTTGQHDAHDRKLGLPDIVAATIRYMVLAILLLIWAVVGFLFWLPMLVNAIIFFSLLNLYATILNAEPDTLAVSLEKSVRFYLQGFENVFRAVRKQTRDGSPTANIKLDLKTIVWHLLITAVFWLVVVFLAW